MEGKWRGANGEGQMARGICVAVLLRVLPSDRDRWVSVHSDIEHSKTLVLK
ncbi:hypothetical protein AB3R30_12550 [Leptolyngbyaceae cyanobacterium UHCC 1019]